MTKKNGIIKKKRVLCVVTDNIPDSDKRIITKARANTVEQSGLFHTEGPAFFITDSLLLICFMFVVIKIYNCLEQPSSDVRYQIHLF